MGLSPHRYDILIADYNPCIFIDYAHLAIISFYGNETLRIPYEFNFLHVSYLRALAQLLIILKVYIFA